MRVTTNCLECSKEISTTEQRLKTGRGKYCSRQCFYRALSRHNKINLPKICGRDSQNGNWKGGVSNAEKYRRKPIEVRYAEKKVQTAKLNGTLTQKPCEVCGKMKSQAHHNDYSKPLEVRWLCPKHHKEADKALGRCK